MKKGSWKSGYVCHKCGHGIYEWPWDLEPCSKCGADNNYMKDKMIIYRVCVEWKGPWYWPKRIETIERKGEETS